MKRLGFSGRTTEIDGSRLSEIERWIDRAADLIELKGAGLRADFEPGSEDEPVIFLESCGCSVRSRKLSSLLADSDQILFLGVTGGAGIVDEISSLQKEGRMTEAVVMDAAASEIVDKAFDWMAGVYSTQIRRESRRLTARRFSAGYGDFELENQKDIYELLSLGRIGVSITESCILIPEKSVTAVYGIVKSAN